MERREIDTPIVTLQDILDGREGIECFERPWTTMGRVFAEA